MDIMIVCKDCEQEFASDVESQQYHIDNSRDNQPVRCKECQRAKKERMNGGPAPC